MPESSLSLNQLWLGVGSFVSLGIAMRKKNSGASSITANDKIIKHNHVLGVLCAERGLAPSTTTLDSANFV